MVAEKNQIVVRNPLIQHIVIKWLSELEEEVTMDLEIIIMLQ
jgi:hypothetical protein